MAEIEQLKKNLEEAKFLVEDAELGEMAREDVKVLTQKIDEKETALGEMFGAAGPNGRQAGNYGNSCGSRR